MRPCESIAGLSDGLRILPSVQQVEQHQSLVRGLPKGHVCHADRSA